MDRTQISAHRKAAAGLRAQARDQRGLKKQFETLAAEAEQRAKDLERIASTLEDQAAAAEAALSSTRTVMNMPASVLPVRPDDGAGRSSGARRPGPIRHGAGTMHGTLEMPAAGVARRRTIRPSAAEPDHDPDGSDRTDRDA